MTAEQHTSIAHSDGDTPRVGIDWEVVAYRKVVRLECDQTWRGDPLNEYTMSEFRRLEESLSRRLARPTPDQIRAAVLGAINDEIENKILYTDADCIRKGMTEAVTSAVAALFDAEVGS